MAPNGRGGRAGGRGRKVIKDGEPHGITKQQADDAKKRQSNIEAHALNWIVTHCKANPIEILSTKAELEAGLGKAMTEIHEDSQQRESFHCTYMAFKSLPRWWIADWMVSKCKFAAKFVDLIDSVPGQLKHVFTYLTGLSEFTYWPRPALKIAVLGEFVTFMAEQSGNRAEGFDKHVNMEGHVDWMKVCPFVLEWAGEVGDRYICSIEHRNVGAKVVIDVVKLTDAFQLEQPWGDLRAQFVGHPTIKPLCIDLIGKTGLKELLCKPNLIKCGEAINLKYEERQAAIVKGQHEILTTAAANARVKAKEAAKKRVPSHKMATALVAPVV